MSVPLPLLYHPLVLLSLMPAESGTAHRSFQVSPTRRLSARASPWGTRPVHGSPITAFIR